MTLNKNDKHLLVNGFSVLAVVSPAHKVWLDARGAPVRAAFPGSGIGVSDVCHFRKWILQGHFRGYYPVYRANHAERTQHTA